MIDNQEIFEELFCINFETKLFAQYVNYGKLERWIPGFSDAVTEECHITRYDFIKQYVTGKSVLDIACGTGKGTSMLAGAGANSVLGVDIDTDTIRYAGHRYKHDNAGFQVADATIYKNQALYDIIVSFETIEHLDDVDKFLKNINANLTDEGLFFVSTPISAHDLDTNPHNIYHKQEWGVNKFQAIVSEFLKVEKSYLQLFPERNTSKLAYYWNRITGGRKDIAIVSTIYPFDTIKENGQIQKLGKSINGYQILQCRKK